MFGRSRPPAPTNVRVRTSDGVETALPVEYAGRRLGISMWQVTMPAQVAVGQPFQILCDELPGRTELGVVVSTVV